MKRTLLGIRLKDTKFKITPHNLKMQQINGTEQVARLTDGENWRSQTGKREF